VLTDSSGFQLGGETADLPVPDAPVWMVHIDGNFPYGYDDVTLQALQASGGGVAGDMDEAFHRLAASLQGSANPDVVTRDIVDGYAWVTVSSNAAIPQSIEIIPHEAGSPFAALAARRLILSEMYQQRGQIEKVETLDHLHTLAKEYGIVTPYSSMIVLINERQHKRLDELEAQDNRFEREAEEVGETALTPMEVTGVPEPHEWLLIIIGAAILVGYTWNKKRTFQKDVIQL